MSLQQRIYNYLQAISPESIKLSELVQELSKEQKTTRVKVLDAAEELFSDSKIKLHRMATDVLLKIELQNKQAPNITTPEVTACQSPAANAAKPTTPNVAIPVVSLTKAKAEPSAIAKPHTKPAPQPIDTETIEHTVLKCIQTNFPSTPFKAPDLIKLLPQYNGTNKIYQALSALSTNSSITRLERGIYTLSSNNPAQKTTPTTLDNNTQTETITMPEPIQTTTTQNQNTQISLSFSNLTDLLKLLDNAKFHAEELQKNLLAITAFDPKFESKTGGTHG